MIQKANRSILVTGAAGGIGRTISRFLLDHHFQVKGLIRPEDDIDRVEVSRENVVIGYIENPKVMAAAMHGVDAVINCAALLPNALHLGAEAFHRVNVSGALNILRQATEQKVKRLIFFSTISVVDHVNRKITAAQLREYVSDTNDAYLLSKINLEKELEKASEAFAGRIDIIRPGFIYGPGNFSVWQDALILIKKGKMSLINEGNVPLPLIYAGDIARFVLLLLDGPDNKGLGIYILANPEPATMRQVFYFIADYLGVPKPRHLPQWTLAIAASLAGVLPEKLKSGRLKLLTAARINQYSKGYDLGSLINPLPLGFEARTNYKEGLAKMLDDYKKTNQS